MKYFSFAAGAFACLLTACQSVEKKAPLVSEIQTTNPGRCEEGRYVYTTVCASCHGVKPVRARTVTEWRGEVLPRMSKKARLSPELEETVLTYIAAVIDTPLPKKDKPDWSDWHAGSGQADAPPAKEEQMGWSDWPGRTEHLTPPPAEQSGSWRNSAEKRNTYLNE